MFDLLQVTQRGPRIICKHESGHFIAETGVWGVRGWGGGEMLFVDLCLVGIQVIIALSGPTEMYNAVNFNVSYRPWLMSLSVLQLTS